MNYKPKNCPHCKLALRIGNGAFELVKKGMAGSEHPPGLSVTLYSCTRCGYIELYDLKAISRI